MGLFDGTPLERPVLCDRCQLPLQECRCPPLDVPPEKQSLTVRLEKRKNGRFVTVVQGFLCSETQIQDLYKLLKNQCGAGGTYDASHLEIQGDHTVRLTQLLKDQQYKITAKK